MEREVSKPRNDREIMAPSSLSKRRKTDHTPSRRILSSAAVEREVSASTRGSTFPVAIGSEIWIQQAKSFAVAEAKQDGCTGNFKIFDSPFRNFLLPVIPSPAEFIE